MTDAPRSDPGPGHGAGSARPGAGDGPDGPGANPAGARRGRGRKGYFLPGFIALAALLAIGGAFGAGDLSHPAPRTLTGSEVASQISLGVEEQGGGSAPPQVTCPPREPVRAGYSFQCALQRGPGQSQPVAVTEVNGRGGLHWSLGAARPSQ